MNSHSDVLSGSPTKKSVENHESSWLTDLQFRHAVSPPLVLAAQYGEAVSFSRCLIAVYDNECRIGKKERSLMLESLRAVRELGESHRRSDDAGCALAQCLFDNDLSADELSGRVEAIMASTAEGRPDQKSLVVAHWLLRMSGKRLEPQTFHTLLRWTMESTRSWLAAVHAGSNEQINPEQGCSVFDYLELMTLNALIIPGLKGDRKEVRNVTRAWRTAVDAITDTDGTPHAKWLGEILPRLAQIAAVSLFADSLNVSLWDKKTRSRLQGLHSRSSLLLTPQQVLFSSVETGVAARALLAVAEILHLEKRPGLLQVLTQWSQPVSGSRGRSRSDKNAVNGKLPRTSTQSDWGEWASLRNQWSGSVDACVVRYSTPIPTIDVLTGNVPFLSGEWGHELKVNGKSVPSSGDWSCCCWNLDEDAVFIELQLEQEDVATVIRQALLLKQESVLLLSDSVRLPAAGKVQLRRKFPLIPGWELAEDTLSRELQLVRGSQRVRVFPWSGPQMKLERTDETIKATGDQIRVSVQGEGAAFYSATMLDWNPKRGDEPVDWQRVTVCEDAQYIPPEVAVGHRLRIGKKQWVLYHSHQKPAIPRSVMGIHTLSETVVASLNNKGDVTTMVEVEL